MVMAVLIAVPMMLLAVPAPAAEDLKIALVVPLSGRWARQGQLKKMGAEMAIAEINAQGGIKSLGGAKIVLREADAGDSVEKAVSAAQRALTREKISAGIGSWLSSFTLGVTAVGQRPARRCVNRVGAADLWLARLHGRRPVRGDRLGNVQRPRHQRLGGHDAIHEAEARRLGGVDQLPGQQQFHGVDVADLLHELHGGAAEWIDRPADFRQPEARVRGRRADVG